MIFTDFISTRQAWTLSPSSGWRTLTSPTCLLATLSVNFSHILCNLKTLSRWEPTRPTPPLPWSRWVRVCTETSGRSYSSLSTSPTPWCFTAELEHVVMSLTPDQTSWHGLRLQATRRELQWNCKWEDKVKTLLRHFRSGCWRGGRLRQGSPPSTPPRGEQRLWTSPLSSAMQSRDLDLDIHNSYSHHYTKDFFVLYFQE